MGLEPIIGQVAYETDTTPVMDLVSALRALEAQSDRLATAFEGQGKAGQETAQRTLDMGAALQKTSDILGGLSAMYSDALAKGTAFGQSMGQVATLSTEVSSDIAAYNQQVLQLSSTMGVEATQAADTFYEALSSGAASDAAGGLKITEVAMKAAVGGATEASVAVDGITTALNAWKLGSDQAGRASDVMFKAVAAGKMTFGELSGAMFQAGPLASSLGISLEEVAAASATLTKSGAPVSAAMTQIRASMTALINPNEEMQVILDRLAQKFPEMGAATGQAALDAFGYHKAMQLIVAESNEAGTALPKVLGSVEAVGAALGVSGANAEGAMADLDAMTNSAGETQKAYDTMANTFGFASNQLKETSNAVLIELGTTLGQMLVPMLQRATEFAQGLLEGWQGLDDGTKQAIVTVGGLVALIGSGIGVFLSLQMTVAALGPLFTTATGGAGAFGSTLTAALGPIGLLVLAVGALVKGAHDLGESYDKQYEKVQKANGGYDEYYAATQRAQESASGLGKVFAFLNRESTLQSDQVRVAGQAFLEHGLNVDKAVLSNAKFQQSAAQLAKEASATPFGPATLSAEEYQAALVKLADETSVAAGKGHVLTEEQTKQSAAFQDSMINVQAHAAGISDATIKSEAFAAQAKIFGDEVASGGMSVEVATQKLLGFAGGLDQVAAKTAETAAAQGVASGALKSYSDDFKALFDAGSKWTSDVGQQNAQVEAAWTSLSQGVQQNLNDQWQGYQKYQEDLAAARQADAEAAAAAVSKRGEIEAAGAEKLKDLNERLENAKTDKQRASAEAAIAKENEKLAGMLAATESVGGANVAKVQEQYNQQVAAQREALAQMIVDHVNSMVLMGQTSEDTAKTIFATLRSAYPGVEVLSPVADAHATLMATIRDATDESSKSQVESIAKLPEALDGAVGNMTDKAAEYNATMDTWATAEEQLAGTSEDSAARRQAASEMAAEVGITAAEQVGLSDEQLMQLVAQRTADTEAAMSQETEARMNAAGETENADQRIRDSSGGLANTVASDAQSIEGSSGLIGAGYGMAADEVADAANRINTGMSSISSGATNLTSSTADLGTKMAGGFRAMLPELEGFERSVKTSETAVKGMKSTSEEMGRSQEKSFGTAGSAASDMGSNVTGAMDESKRGMGEARTSAEELTVALTEIPDIVQTEIVLLGVKEALGDLAHIMGLMQALRNQGPGDLPSPPGGSSGGGSSGPPPPGPHSALPPGDSLQPPGDAEAWNDFTTAVSEADAAVAAFYQTAGGGVTVTAAYQPDSPALEFSSDGLRVMWALEDLYKATEDPFIIVGVFDDSDFLARIAVAQSGITTLQDEAERLAGRLKAAYDAFLRGGAGDEGSLAWLFSKWQSEGAMPDLAKTFEDLNLPVKDMQQFMQYWDQLGPDEQMVAWKRLYDELRRQENERWEQRQKNLKDQIEALKAGNHDTTALDTQMKAEKAAHDERMDQLEERNRLIQRQFGYYRDGVKDVTEAQRDLAALEKEMDRARQEYIRAEVERLKDQQKRAEDYDTTAHDRVMEMLDEEEERLKAKQALELKQIEDLLTAEESRHDKVTGMLADEAQAIKDYIDEQEKGLRLSKLDLEDWVASLGLDALKSDLKEINDAIRDLPSGRDLAGGGGRERAKPEDMARVAITEGQRSVLQQALGAGVFGEEDAARARIALGQGKLRLDYLRRLLDLTQKYYQTQVSNTEDEIDRRKEEFEAADRRWKREKEGLDDQLKGIEARRTAEDEYYNANKARIEGERTALETKQQAEMDALDRLRDAEERRHDARMKQLEEEYAMAIMIAEGMSPADAAQKIAELRENVRKAQEDAAKLLEELRKNQGATAPGVGGGSTPVNPGQPVPPPGGIAPPPKGVTGMTTGSGSETDGTKETNPWRYAETNPWRYAKGNSPGDPLWVAIAEALESGAPRLPGSDPVEGDPGMTLSDFLGMLPSDAAPGRGAGGGGGALFTAGDTVNTQFWGPVYIEEGTEPDRLLRKSLGGGWGTRGTP